MKNTSTTQKIILFVLIILLAFTLVGCEKKESTPKSECLKACGSDFTCRLSCSGLSDLPGLPASNPINQK